MKSIQYRIGTLTDLQEIKTLSLTAYGQFNDLLTHENVIAWTNNLGSDATYLTLFSTATCFVALADDKIVGVVFLVQSGNPFKWFAAEWCYIRLLSVHPEFGGQGIGKQLTQMCIDLAQKNNEQYIALHTSEFQHAARHIYENLGFEKQKEFILFEKKYWVYILPLLK